MASKKVTRRALIGSMLSLLLCCSMLIGTTFAWFTDTVTSTGNIIKSGTLDVEMTWANSNSATETDWKDAAEGAIFNYRYWEPGYTEVRYVKVKNVGDLAFKFQMNIIPSVNPVIGATNLADVIDVHMADVTDGTSFADRAAAMAGTQKVGVLSALMSDPNGAAHGTMLPADGKGSDKAVAPADAITGEITYCIVLHMQESAGNEYQNLDVGDGFAVQLLATQMTYEKDSFNEQYDEEATLDFTPVSNIDELRLALANKKTNIMLTKNIVAADEPFTVDYNANINGSGYAIARVDAAAEGVMLADAEPVYTGAVFTVKSGSTLSLENVVVDGGAVWTGEVNETLRRGMVNAGVTATGALVTTEGNGSVVLNKGAVLQNNDGANAVFLSTRTGGTLTLNGGEIINNHSAAGAIWGGGAITINSGKVNGNHGGIGGAIRVVTNIGTVLTMNGGEMNHNLSDNVGGAIWAGTSQSNNVYVLNGGEMAYNYSPVTGGAIYAGYYETVKIGGTFKMHDNAAPVYGAIRFHDHASFVMTGGEIYNNGENSLFLNNNSASITGGKITDSFGYNGGLGLTWGEAEVDGVINYNLGTNHNTAYLAETFNTLKFTVNQSAANFSQFNFKPADGYTYTEGDEAKLVCMNDGYSTYWDAATGTFRLQAN